MSVLLEAGPRSALPGETDARAEIAEFMHQRFGPMLDNPQEGELLGLHRIARGKLYTDTFPVTAEGIAELIDAALVDSAMASSKGVYVRSATLNADPGEQSRGGKNSTSRMSGLWLDIDMDEKDAPIGDYADALAMVERFSIAPTHLLYSGNGLHAYWELAEAIDDQAEMDEVLGSFKEAWLSIPACGGWAVDRLVFEHSRVMRLPATANRDSSRNGGITSYSRAVHGSGERYALDELLDATEAMREEYAPEVLVSITSDLEATGLDPSHNVQVQPTQGTTGGSRARSEQLTERGDIIDAYNAKKDLPELLRRAGFGHVKGTEYTRPGTTNGETNCQVKGGDKLHIYTDRIRADFPSLDLRKGKQLSAFQVLQICVHNGNFGKAMDEARAFVNAPAFGASQAAEVMA